MLNVGAEWGRGAQAGGAGRERVFGRKDGVYHEKERGGSSSNTASEERDIAAV